MGNLFEAGTLRVGKCSCLAGIPFLQEGEEVNISFRRADSYLAKQSRERIRSAGAGTAASNERCELGQRI